MDDKYPVSKEVFDAATPEERQLLTVTQMTYSEKPSGQGQVAQKRGTSPNNKYHAVRTDFKGRNYPSKHQAEKAEMFYQQRDAGIIKGVLEEVPFQLPGKTEGGRQIVHRVDFGIIELDDRVSWYEAKGKELELGRLKRVQVEELYHIKVTVI